MVDSGKGSNKLGSVTVHLKDLLRAKDMTVNRPFQLKGADPQSKIQMTLCLRVSVPCQLHFHTLQCLLWLSVSVTTATVVVVSGQKNKQMLQWSLFTCNQCGLTSQILTSFKPDNWSQDSIFPQQPPPASKAEEKDDEKEQELKGGAGKTPPRTPPTNRKTGSREPSAERSSPPASPKKKDNDEQHDFSRSSTATPERPVGQELRQRTVGKQ